MKDKKLTTTSPEQTMAIAEKLGKNLKGGECIQLVSDVGGGKTTFTRGLAKGAGSEDHVSSPTFTISKVYRAQDFQIVHFDFYRLSEPGLIEHELEEAAGDPTNVIVVEWSDIVEHVLPAELLKVSIESKGEQTREVTLSSPARLEYLMEGIE